MNYTLLPLMIIFDAELVLWPIEFHPHQIKFPCIKISGTVYDSSFFKRTINCYPEVSAIFKKLKNAAIKIAIISFRGGINSDKVNHLLQLFDLDKYISFIEVDEPFDFLNFEKIHQESNIPFNKMIYLINEPTYPNYKINEQGVHIKNIFQKDNISMKLLHETLKEYKSKQ